MSRRSSALPSPLQAAGFTTRHSIHEPRCSGCRHVELSTRLKGGTAYDRHCRVLKADVKTHGHCRMFAASGEQR